MKPDEELTKQQGRPVIKGVMEADDLEIGQEGDEEVAELEEEDERRKQPPTP